MRIAVLTSSLPPRSIGGAEIQAHATALRLAARGHEVTVFARAVPGDPGGISEEGGVRWVRSVTPSVPGLRFAGHVRSFLGLWDRWGRDAEVILAYQLVINGVLGVLASRRGGAPLVSWIRSTMEVDVGRALKYRLLSPWTLERTHRILVQTETMKDVLRDRLGTRVAPERMEAVLDRTRVLSNAVEPGPEPGYAGRSGVVFLGRLVPEKGLEVLLDALRRLSPPPPLTVFGDGPLRARWESLARGLPVTFAGPVIPCDIAGKLSHARVLASPSWSEGFPNAILEAMARGVPVVGTRVGGVADVVRDGVTGFLVEPGDSGALAERIRVLLEDDALWERTARAARAAVARYGWDAHLEALESILEEAQAST